MKAERKSFTLYTDLQQKTAELSREDKGALFEMILAYENGDALPDDVPYGAKVAFSFVKPMLDESARKYDEIVEKRKKAAEKRWEKPTEETEQTSDDMHMDAHGMQMDANGMQTECTSMHKEKDKEKEINILTKSNDLVCQTKSDILPKAEAQKIVQSWNEKAGAKGAPQVYLMSESSKRYKSLKARVQEYGIPKVLEAIDKVAESDFLCHGNSKWRGATFDWLVLPNNFSKVLEGNYSDRERASPENPMDDPDIMGYLRRKHGIR